MESRSTLFLVPARGGSKGIPSKNLKNFCGEPLVSRAVKQAINCAGANDTVFLSTDSNEIKKAAEIAGADIPFIRPAELATDTASTYDVIIHALKEFKQRGKEFEKVVLLQPTSPFREEEDIYGAIGLWSPEIDMVVSVVESKSNPYFNLFEEDNSGYLHISKGNGLYVRRQDVPRVYEYNGAVYVMTVKSLLSSPISRFKKIKPFLMPASRSVDIDTPEDWIIAETIYEKMHKNKG